MKKPVSRIDSSNKQKRRTRRARQQASARRKSVVQVVFILLVILIAVYLGWSGSRPAGTLADSVISTTGKEVYFQYCAACHGDQGQGHAGLAEAPALDDSEHAWHHPDGQLRQIITGGGNVMPSFSEQLNDSDIFAVIRYIQTWWTQAQLDSQQNASRTNPFD